MIKRISKVVFPPQTVGKPLRTTKLKFTIIKIPYVNTMKEEFLYDQKIPHLQKIIHSNWNITIDHQKRFNNRKPSILLQVVIILLLVSAVLSYSIGNSLKKSHHSGRWNLSTSKVQSRVSDSNEEGKCSDHCCHWRKEEKHAEKDSRDVTSSLGQTSTKLLEPQEPNQFFSSNQGTIVELSHSWKAPGTNPRQRGGTEEIFPSKPNQILPSNQGTTGE